MVLGIQLLGGAFGIFMLYLSFLHFKRREFSKLEFLVWVLLWSLMIFVAFFPNSLDFLVKNILRLKRPLDFFIICGFLFLSLLTFINYSLNKANRRKIEQVISGLALQKSGDERKER